MFSIKTQYLDLICMFSNLFNCSPGFVVCDVFFWLPNYCVQQNCFRCAWFSAKWYCKEHFDEIQQKEALNYPFYRYHVYMMTIMAFWLWFVPFTFVATHVANSDCLCRLCVLIRGKKNHHPGPRDNASNLGDIPPALWGTGGLGIVSSFMSLYRTFMSDVFLGRKLFLFVVPLSHGSGSTPPPVCFAFAATWTICWNSSIYRWSAFVFFQVFSKF